MAKRQAEIPGTERVKNKQVDAAAEAYVDQRDKRMKLSKKEKAAKDALIAEMKKAGVTIYKDTEAVPPLIVTLSAKDNVRVEQLGERDEESEEDDVEKN